MRIEDRFGSDRPLAFGSSNRWIGFVSLIIGALLGLMLFFEIKDGTLYGSKADGMTVISNPVTFYVATIIQGLIVLLMIFGGISIIRSKE